MAPVEELELAFQPGIDAAALPEHAAGTAGRVDDAGTHCRRPPRPCRSERPVVRTAARQCRWLQLDHRSGPAVGRRGRGPVTASAGRDVSESAQPARRAALNPYRQHLHFTHFGVILSHDDIG